MFKGSLIKFICDNITKVYFNTLFIIPPWQQYFIIKI